MVHRKKIVQLIVSLERGGAEMALLRMLPNLNDEFEHIFITLRNRGSVADEFEKLGIQVIPLGQKNIFDFFSYIRLRRILQSLSPDLIITNLFHADIVGRLFVQSFVDCKVISSLVTTYNSRRYWVARVFERLTRGLATGYIANAESVRRAYTADFLVAPEKILVLPCGMSIDRFRNTIEDGTLKTSVGVVNSDFVIICVANLHVNKGHRFLLEAFEHFSLQHPQSRLLLVGEGPERERLIAQLKRYHSKPLVSFLGKRTDVPALLAISNVFVLPTFFEGMSNAIMEAMASGLPVITTDIPGNRELIENGKTGILCPIQSAISLEKALGDVIVNPDWSRTLGDRASAMISERYDMPQAIIQWKKTYSLLSQRV